MPKITVNNIELYYQEHGDGPVAIIFGHGFLASSKMWYEHYVSRLDDRYRAYMLDMRGHGQSHHIESGCNVVQLANDIYQFSQKLDIETFNYVGMSMGAAVGIQLALDHPEVLDAMILMNPGLGSTISERHRFILPLVASTAKKRWLIKRLLKSTLTTAIDEAYLRTFVQDAMLVSKKVWLEYLDPKNKIQDLNRLGRFQKPALVMLGGKDRVLPAKTQHSLAGVFADAKKVVYEDAGHGMFCEIPEEIFRQISTFFEQLAIGTNT